MQNKQKIILITVVAVIVIVFLILLAWFNLKTGTQPTQYSGNLPTSSSQELPMVNSATVVPTPANVAVPNAGNKDLSAATPFVCGAPVTGRSPDTTIYQTVLGADGHCWLASNLGTSHIATAYNDSAAYGWLYQWGRLTDGHQIPTSNITMTLSNSDVPGNADFIYGMNDNIYDWRSPQNDNLWQGVNGINNPCPSGWRIPTQTEWDTLITAAGITNSATAFSSSLKLSVAGYRNYRESSSFNNYHAAALFFQGMLGYYWSSSIFARRNASLLSFSSNANPATPAFRADAGSVRCIKDY